MAVTAALHTNGSGGSTTDTTSYTTGSIAPAGDRLQVAFVDASRSGAEPDTPTLTGNGLTWVLEDAVYYKTSGNTLKLFVFRAMGASPSSGTVSIDFGANTHLGCRWDFIEVDGVDTGGTNGSGAVVQSVTNSTASLASGGTLSISLAAAVNPDSRPLSGWGLNSNAAGMTPRANWTELSEDNHSTPSQALESQWRSDAFEQTADVTNDTGIAAACGGIALEIKAAAAAVPTPPIQVVALRPAG